MKSPENTVEVYLSPLLGKDYSGRLLSYALTRPIGPNIPGTSSTYPSVGWAALFPSRLYKGGERVLVLPSLPTSCQGYVKDSIRGILNDANGTTLIKDVSFKGEYFTCVRERPSRKVFFRFLIEFPMVWPEKAIKDSLERAVKGVSALETAMGLKKRAVVSKVHLNIPEKFEHLGSKRINYALESGRIEPTLTIEDFEKTGIIGTKIKGKRDNPILRGPLYMVTASSFWLTTPTHVGVYLNTFRIGLLSSKTVKTKAWPTIVATKREEAQEELAKSLLLPGSITQEGLPYPFRNTGKELEDKVKALKYTFKALDNVRRKPALHSEWLGYSIHGNGMSSLTNIAWMKVQFDKDGGTLTSGTKKTLETWGLA